jgi:hypothetical protein
VTVLDDKTAQILANWLDESRWYPGDDEYPGDPEIHHETQWRVLRKYFNQDLDAAAGKPKPQDDRVQPIEALALARLLADGLRAAYWGIIYDARKAGDSWTDIGNALGIARQSAHEMYAKDLEAYAKKMEGRVGSDFFAQHRPEYESVLADDTTEQ